MKKILLLILSIFTFGATFAQDDVYLTQLYANKLYYNPAATGFADKFFVSGAYRAQWAGTPGIAKEDRPGYVLLNASQFFWERRSGVGLTVYDGRQHVNHTFQVKGTYAYHLQVQEEAWLSIGLNLGLVSRSLQGGVTAHGNMVDYRNGLMSDLGFGLEYYTPELCVGASVQHIPLVLGTIDERFHAHFYYYMTYYYRINENWRVIPSVFMRNSSFITNADLMVRASYLNMFQLGVAWRFDAISLLVGFNFQDMFSLGYSYDIHTGHLREVNTKPSHEIILSYRTQIINTYNTLQRLETQYDF